jgi:long-chain acyl-CoA synthetase
MTLPARLLELASTKPTRVAFRRKRLGIWEETTYGRYGELVAGLGMGLVELGVRHGDRVAIQSDNRPEWLLTDVAVQGIGAITVGVYPTSPEAELLHVLADSGATVFVAEDEEQLDKVLAIRDQLPGLRHVVVVDAPPVLAPSVLRFEDLSAPGVGFAERVGALDPQACAAIVYTSGTTGPPKGAMLSHANLLAAGDAAVELNGEHPDDEVLSYLPLSHIAERILSVVGALRAGYTVNFGEGGDSLAAELREVQPTLFLGVPRVWEKVLASTEVQVADASWAKRSTYRFWVGQGRKRAARRQSGTLGLVDKVVLGIGWLVLFRPLREKLGMSRVRDALSGAAPIAPQVLEWLWAIGIPVREVYGQTENTAMATYVRHGAVRIGTVGQALPGVELRVADDGEVLTRSAGNFLGYWGDEQASVEALDGDGWLRTGDVGVLDADGFLTITDRKKDIIVTAGGENIAPSEIENRLKVSPFIQEAIVVGDRRRFVSALIGIDADNVAAWASRRQLPFTTYDDLAGKPEVEALVREAVEDVNGELAQVAEIKAFRLLPAELDEEEGELTPTQKVKRAAIASRYAHLIDEMYGQDQVKA